MKTKLLLSLLLVTLLGLTTTVLASETNGTIDAGNRYAYSENLGWIDFGTTEGAVHVTDTALTGYAWGENVGWISLNCSNNSSCGTVDYKVANNGTGTLSGYAWSENLGWIDFSPSGGGVTIDSAGDFQGSAWGENVGWITFNCAVTSSCGTVNYKVKTDWRPSNVRVTVTGAVPSHGSLSGGDAITITGTNFSGTPTVTFGGTASQSVTVQNSTTILATAPAHATGLVDVVVTSTNSSGTLVGSFTYTELPPTVTTVSPNSGLPAGGTNVTLTGTNFSNGIDSYTKLLLHGDGSGTSFADSSGTGKSITAYGNATQSATQSMFGGKAMYFDGTNSYLTTPSGSDWVLGTGDFTIDFWLRGDGANNQNAIFSSNINAASWWTQNGDYLIYFADSTTVFLTQYDGTTNHWLAGAWNISSGSWNHIAFVRSGNTFSAYKDGVLQGNADVTGYTFGRSGTLPGLGKVQTGSGYLNGYVDEFRVTKGLARWTSNFTPPTSAYSVPATVTIGGTSATGVLVTNSTTMSLSTPAKSSGTYDVVVTNSDGGTGTKSAAFTYLSQPTITGITPSTGSTAGGESKTISGTNFVGTPTVTVGGTGATVTATSSTSITISTPAHSAGVVEVLLTNPDNQTATTSFTYIAPAVPNSTTPDINGNATLTNSTSTVVISSSTQPVILTVTTGTTNPTIDTTAFISGGMGNLPSITMNSSLAVVSIPSTTVTSSNSSWTGTMSAPKVSSVPLSVPNQTGAISIKLGVAGETLTFTQAVKILFPNKADKLVGYSTNGITFTEITTLCTADTQLAGNSLPPGGDCKMNSGSDLVVWTKHFTDYIVFEGQIIALDATSTVATLDINKTIAIACTPSLNLTQIIGYGQSDLTGNGASCNIVTNSTQGYKLELSVASTTASLKATDDNTHEILPLASNLTTWQTLPTESRWGVATGTVSYSSGNWLSPTVGAQTLVSSPTHTLITGDNIPMKFGAEVGANYIQPSGTYTADVTLTATTL